MARTLFSDIPSFVRAPRITGLTASRSGLVIATRRMINDAGTAFIDQLFEVTPDRARQLTWGDKSASLLGIGERGELYFTREDPGEKERGSAIWMLPPTGEAREIFRYKAGIVALQATRANLLLTLAVLPGAADAADGSAAPSATERLLGASHTLATKRAAAKTSAVLHSIYPIRSWDHDRGPGENRLFVSPLPSLYCDPGLEPYSPSEGPSSSNADPFHAAKEAPLHSGAEEEEDDGGEYTLPPTELSLTEVPLPPAPEGVDEWSLAYAIPLPIGTHAFAVMTGRTTIDSFNQVWLVDLTGAQPPRFVAADPKADYDVAGVSFDSTWALLARNLPPLPGQTVDVEYQSFSIATGATTRVASHVWGKPVIAPDGAIYLTADRRGRGGVFRLSTSGEPVLLTPDDEYTYNNLAWAGDHLVALRSSIAEPPAVVVIDPVTGEVARGPELTPELELPGELTEIGATAKDGTPIRAWLAVPDGEGPHPLVVFAHGGPWGAWNDWTWRWNPWVFVAHGYAVLLPDPGISTGYGHHMISRGHDAIGDEPFTDIMALADAAVARPDINQDHQAFAGGSYGGYMANWVAGHTGTRFACIVTHAGLWNVGAMSTTTDNGSWYRWMMGSNPAIGHGLSQAEMWSPHLFAKKIAVPMLVIHGDKDYRVPFGQALELWADLQRLSPQLGHQFLYFPDEGHWILKPANAEIWYETFVAFLDEHVRGKKFKRADLLG